MIDDMKRDFYTKLLLDVLVHFFLVNLDYLYFNNLWWLLPKELNFLWNYEKRKSKLIIK